MKRLEDRSTNIEIAVDNSGAGAIIRLKGRIDVDSSPDVRDHLQAVLSRDPLPHAVTVDLSDLSSIEASGIARQSMERIVIPGQRSKSVAKRSMAPLHRCQRAGEWQPVTSAIHQSSSKLQSCLPYALPRNYLCDLTVLGSAVQKLLFEYAGGSEPLKNGRCP